MLQTMRRAVKNNNDKQVNRLNVFEKVQHFFVCLNSKTNPLMILSGSSMEQ